MNEIYIYIYIYVQLPSTLPEFSQKYFVIKSEIPYLIRTDYSGCKMRGSNIIIAYRGVRVLIKVRENIKKVLKF